MPTTYRSYVNQNGHEIYVILYNSDEIFRWDDSQRQDINEIYVFKNYMHNRHCCKCKMIKTCNSEHCCKCQMCFPKYDMHCCNCKINYERNVDKHCCKCKILYKYEHCCECKKRFRKEDYHCDKHIPHCVSQNSNNCVSCNKNA